MTTVPSLELNATLRQRINPTVQCPDKPRNSFVLYLPTVNLRFKHNPAFAYACHLANHHEVPVLVLAIVLDDAHLPTSTPKNNNDNITMKRRPIVVSTARRTAFVLEALQQATREWQEHGAGVAIRVHGPECRTPHHLTLVRQSVAVVVDEPFVHPFLSMVQSVESVARSCQVPVVRVDGSTTVAPVCMLRRGVDKDGNVSFDGVPSKAWVWEKKTEPKRNCQVLGVVQDGHFDAPVLVKRLKMNFFLDQSTALALKLPSYWANPETPSPGKRPWTTQELSAISDLKAWVLEWPGIDTSVPPCSQTHGSTTSGQQRWNRFRQLHLSNYAKLRNNICKPHAVSRMSCYLNYGCVSIFQIIFDLRQSRSAGASKFADEIIKWREIGYAHSFAYPRHYNTSEAVPQWARTYLAKFQGRVGSAYSIEQLESCSTNDDTWNAMQDYLNTTGELHNNARMTWGKTVVHWQKYNSSVDELLQQLIYLNDRYALDGLSPPSYAGLLWCLGWGDNPTDSLSQKPASRYRQGPSAFADAKLTLLAFKGEKSIATMLAREQESPAAKKRRIVTKTTEAPDDKKISILSYFQGPQSHMKSVG